MTSPDGEFSYLEWGGSDPSLLFGHATGFNARTYRVLLQPLEGRMRVIAPDLRGHGFNTLPTEPGSAKDWTIYAQDIVRFLEILGNKPMILAGHSMGATTSVMAALLKPKLVRGLVLIEPVFAPARWSRVHLQSMLRFWKRQPSLAERAARRRDRFESLEAAEQAYRGRGAFQAWPDAVLHDYLSGGLLPAEGGGVRLACAPRWEAETFMSAPRGTTGLAGRLRCPVTIIYGGLSNTCSDEEAARFARNHAGTRRVRVAKATHFLPMEYPDVVRTEIARMARILPREI